MSSLVFDPVAYARDVEAAALAGGWSVDHLTPSASGPRPWFRREAGPDAPRLYLSAGIHGDEVSGPWAILEMLRRPDFFAGFHVVIFPILNPDGMARVIRGNADGIDLNRDYRETKSAEIRGHIEALKTLGRFDVSLMLHEDFEGIGAYLYELNESLPETLGGEIMAAMGHHVPIDLRPVIEEVPAQGGVISRKDLIRIMGPIEERSEWPEALYLSLHHCRVNYTTETPMPFPLESRVQAQIAAVETVMRVLRKTASSANPS